jgi:hypothetical protein
MEIDPAVPFARVAAFPVPMYSHPVLPFTDSPVLNTMSPLLPAVLASDVIRVNLPLDDAVLLPVNTITSPPLAVTSSVCPADKTIFPP